LITLIMLYRKVERGYGKQLGLPTEKKERN
jgi:hypothetical protein